MGEAKLKVNFASPPTDSRVAVGSVSDSVTPDRPTRRAQRGGANFGSGRPDRPTRPAGRAAIRPDSALPTDRPQLEPAPPIAMRRGVIIT